MKTVFSKAEVLFTLALTLCSFVIFYMSYKLGFGSTKQPGPGFFPALVGLFGLVFGILLIIHYLGQKPMKGESKIFEKGQKARFIAMVAIFCGWLISLPWLGFIIVTFFATLAFAKIMGLEGWLRPVLLSIGGAVFIYLLFDVWFYSDLPRGFLGI